MSREAASSSAGLVASSSVRSFFSSDSVRASDASVRARRSPSVRSSGCTRLRPMMFSICVSSCSIALTTRSESGAPGGRSPIRSTALRRRGRGADFGLATAFRDARGLTDALALPSAFSAAAIFDFSEPTVVVAIVLRRAPTPARCAGDNLEDARRTGFFAATFFTGVFLTVFLTAFLTAGRFAAGFFATGFFAATVFFTAVLRTPIANPARAGVLAGRAADVVAMVRSRLHWRRRGTRGSRQVRKNTNQTTPRIKIARPVLMAKSASTEGPGSPCRTLVGVSTI